MQFSCSAKPNLSVWLQELKRFVRFQGGQLTTEDPATADALQRVARECPGEGITFEVPPEEPGLDELTVKQLRELGEALGAELKSGMTKAELIEALKVAQGEAPEAAPPGE